MSSKGLISAYLPQEMINQIDELGNRFKLNRSKMVTALLAQALANGTEEAADRMTFHPERAAKRFIELTNPRIAFTDRRQCGYEAPNPPSISHVYECPDLTSTERDNIRDNWKEFRDAWLQVIQPNRDILKYVANLVANGIQPTGYEEWVQRVWAMKLAPYVEQAGKEAEPVVLDGSA